MNDMVIVSIDNKRYTKISKYETLLIEENKKESNKSIKYKEILIGIIKDLIHIRLR